MRPGGQDGAPPLRPRPIHARPQLRLRPSNQLGCHQTFGDHQAVTAVAGHPPRCDGAGLVAGRGPEMGTLELIIGASHPKSWSGLHRGGRCGRRWRPMVLDPGRGADAPCCRAQVTGAPTVPRVRCRGSKIREGMPLDGPSQRQRGPVIRGSGGPQGESRHSEPWGDRLRSCAPARSPWAPRGSCPLMRPHTDAASAPPLVVRWWWSRRYCRTANSAAIPSPTAEPSCLVDPCRTSPAQKTPASEV